MRCVSITSCPVAEISAADASCCSLIAATASAASSKSEDWPLIARSANPTWVSTFCCASTTPAFLPALSTSGISGSRASCTAGGAAAMSASPFLRPSTVRCSTSELSRTSGKALGLPTRACETDFARRCDCISAWPLAATCAALLLAEFSDTKVIASSPATPASTRPPRMRCCCATGWRPISGRPASSAAACDGAPPCSGAPPMSVGTTSEMIDDSGPSFCCKVAGS